MFVSKNILNFRFADSEGSQTGQYKRVIRDYATSFPTTRQISFD